MIRPAGFRGAAFGDASDGNARDDDGVRHRWSLELGIPGDWAWVRQVHGSVVADVAGPGPAGEADGVITSTPGLPVTVATADCVPVVIEGDGVVAVLHAGWRGTAAGVVEEMLRSLAARGTPARRAAVGPAIGPCCYEVGPDVARHFPGFEAETTWGSGSIDLPGAVAAKLGDLDVWRSDVCTMGSEGYHSYRRDRTTGRQVAVGWLPKA